MIRSPREKIFIHFHSCMELTEINAVNESLAYEKLPFLLGIEVCYDICNRV